ncbi:hypothetical protein BJX63DRAFT_426659 [Aspergillus granulosus]|uniref:Uncharacterized protein n=1 Tax=Aspergillus granulosus TaxID=176169 RepID=A0ABR4GR53_9EURO
MATPSGLDNSIYISVHRSTQGPGDARPAAQQIITDYNLEGILKGKDALITGCSSGIGIEQPKARTALQDLSEQNDSRIYILPLDLSSLSSIRAFAEEFKSQSKGKLNIFIANAGVMACPEGRTEDGFETQFGTNHLGHFLLFHLLKDLLQQSSTESLNSRAILLSSCAHQAGSVHFDNLTLEGEYEPWKAYGQSKTANLWIVREIEARFGSRGLHSWAVHPGSIVTELQRHVSDELRKQWAENEELGRHWKDVPQGAATTVLAAVAPELEGRGGLYLEDTKVAELPGTGQRRLWDVSEKLLGLV